MNEQGPSQGVADQLLPHLHLISVTRYPVLPKLEPQRAIDLLMQAPKIARDDAPFCWQYLDTPQDGTIHLMWQPLVRLGTDMASDGYIWNGPEIMYQHDLGNGLTLEHYHYKAGFKPMEPYTMHSRRRYRLVPSSKVPHANHPPVDPSLFVVAWGPSESHDRMPASSVPVDNRTSYIMNFRAQMQRAGPIARKDFMLRDRGNYPQIPFRGFPQAPGPRQPMPQTMAYPPAHPPTKRGARAQQQQQAQQQHHAQHHPQQPHHPAAHSAIEYEDEEDTSRGDIFDSLTPRDVSMARYRQNYELMEEILCSPYRMGQIVMPDLGLGLKGELAGLTDGIFEAQGEGAHKTAPKKAYVGKLDGELADQFRKRVAEQIEATQTEIKALEAQHAKMMAEFESGKLLMRAERDLRGVSKKSDSGSGGDFWRLEGRADGIAEDGTISLGRGVDSKDLDQVVAEVEARVGRKAVAVQDVRRVQDGGYQEPVAPPLRVEPDPVLIEAQQQQQPLLDPMLNHPAASAGPPAASSMSRNPSHPGSQHSGVMVGDSDVDMGNTAAGLLDQMNPSGFSTTSTPVNNFPTPQPQLSAAQSNAGTPANAGMPSPHPPPPQPQAAPSTSQDVDMGNTETPASKEPTPPTAPDQGTGSGDWVVVPKNASDAASGSGVMGPSPNGGAGTPVPAPGGAPGGASTMGNPATVAQKPAATAAAAPASVPAAPTPNKPLTPGDFSNLGDLPGSSEFDLNMEMEDSAFGDAFHGVSESREGSGDVGSGI
ncbi:hypothetical protein MCOR04_006352 [Pyricularia oryzae]|uniref:DUF1750-domain-containing protein n=1 Tax=Pyricularia oryzae TaxID=318829 RepID=A0A4P7NLY9_PYROR|nr:hypothetical protein MCOR17_002000 [Pyricularia oryzae]KAI6578628.1 hypothetical protein MCOR04_006352 [Pyricularia oryzae]QBZ63194.1 hypothetical protein PoMZ_12091 [Pyricularia oryzae]